MATASADPEIRRYNRVHDRQGRPAPALSIEEAERAIILLTRWLFERGAGRVFLTIVAENHGSVAVARRAGFEHEGTVRDYGIWQGERCDVMVFAALATEWPPEAHPLIGMSAARARTAACECGGAVVRRRRRSLPVGGGDIAF